MILEDSDCVEEEGIVDFQWAETSNQLLVQRYEQVDWFEVGNGLARKGCKCLKKNEIIGSGYANQSWWFLLKQQEQVRFHRVPGSTGILLDGADAGTIYRPALSPDGHTLAFAGSKLTVSFWSVETGKRLFGCRIDYTSVNEDLFGTPDIRKLAWSADSRFLAIQPGIPFEQLTVIDVPEKKSVGDIFG